MYIVYNHFDRLLHVRSLDPTFEQNSDLYIPLIAFDIQGFKLKNNNNNGNDNKNNWRSVDFCHSPMLVVQYYSKHILHIDLSYHYVMSKVDCGSANCNF